MAQAQETPLGAVTPLKPVRDWGWHRWRVRYWEAEGDEEAGREPVLTREFVESENGAEAWVCGHPGEQPEGGWPARRYGGRPATYASWDVVERNVERTLRFQRSPRGGTEVVGAGWCAPAPQNWLARGPG